ncbi:MAG: SufE family protein [Bacteroidia bacterium]|nr:SufE family protein [Bacteroidia bacterium]
MRTIEDKEREIIEDFELFDSWADKYQYIIELGQKLEQLDDLYKKKKYKIKGCQSSVWLIADLKDGNVQYKVDSDSTFVKGLASLYVQIYNSQSPENIINHEVKFVEEIGLKQHLAANRTGGLAAIAKQMKLYAIALQSAAQIK